MVGRVEHWSDADGTEVEYEQGPVTKIKRNYWATLTDVNTDPLIIYDYKDCPKPGGRYKKHAGALATRIVCTQVAASKIYKVAVEWSTNANGADADPNPLKRAAIIDIDTTLEEVETFRDGKDRIMINTAGDIQVRTKLKPFKTIRVRKNVSTVPAWFSQLPGHVNKSAVTIKGVVYDKRTLLLGASEEPDRILENKVWYYPISFSLRHDSDTHDYFEPSMGINHLVQVPSAEEVNAKKQQGINPEVADVKKRITLGPGDYATEPQYLDKNGRHIQLDPDKVSGGLDTDKIHIIQRKIQPEEDLNILPFR